MPVFVAKIFVFLFSFVSILLALNRSLDWGTERWSDRGRVFLFLSIQAFLVLLLWVSDVISRGYGLKLPQVALLPFLLGIVVGVLLFVMQKKRAAKNRVRRNKSRAH